jgi:fructokinase
MTNRDVPGKFVNRPAIMVGLGELLWDLLPSGKKLGGAPANFAYMANVLGDHGIVASRIGDDELGREAKVAVQALGLDTRYVQQDHSHPTSTSAVALDNEGQPEFKIKESVSWDYLEWSPEWADLASGADVICFGSLAQRSPVAAATITRFLWTAPKETLCIYDVNLRQSFYDKELLQRSFEHAHVVKLNHQELPKVSSLLEVDSGSEEAQARQLLEKFDLRLVCVTRGARGSLLVSPDETVTREGLRVKVADAVGAGDAFTACLAHHYVRGRSLQDINEYANRFAAWVATKVGATPLIDEMQLQEIMGEISTG